MRRTLRKLIRAIPPPPQRKPDPAKRPIRTRRREPPTPPAAPAPPRLLPGASLRLRPKAPGRLTAKTRIPLQRRRARRRRALQPILRRARRRQPVTLRQPGRPRPAQQASGNRRAHRATLATPQARRPGIQRKTLRLEQIPAIPPARGLRNRPRGRRTRQATRVNRPTLPAPLTQGHLPLLQQPALATPPARGPPRSP